LPFLDHGLLLHLLFFPLLQFSCRIVNLPSSQLPPKSTEQQEAEQTMSHFITAPPDPSEYAPFYGTYISLVPERDILEAMSLQNEATLGFLSTLSPSAGHHRYAPGKWSINEVIGHVIDSERVFTQRALFFARSAPLSLPGFEQDDWINAAAFDSVPLAELASEFESVRLSTLYFFRHLSQDAWLRRGVANNCEFTVRALAYIIVGHERHHLEILRTRYT